LKKTMFGAVALGLILDRAREPSDVKYHPIQMVFQM